MVYAGLAAGSATPDVTLWRLATWLIVAMFEVALLYLSPAIFLPAFLVGAVAAAILGRIRKATRTSRGAKVEIPEGISPSRDPDRSAHQPSERGRASTGAL
jgi:hypothetical protein